MQIYLSHMIWHWHKNSSNFPSFWYDNAAFFTRFALRSNPLYALSVLFWSGKFEVLLPIQNRRTHYKNARVCNSPDLLIIHKINPSPIPPSPLHAPELLSKNQSQDHSYSKNRRTSFKPKRLSRTPSDQRLPTRQGEMHWNSPKARAAPAN